MLEYWTNPPVDPIIKVYVFNYTNIIEVLEGTEKQIKVQEVGPYVYRERVKKTGLKFEEHRISFYVRRFTHFKHFVICFVSILGK